MNKWAKKLEDLEKAKEKVKVEVSSTGAGQEKEKMTVEEML